MFFLVTGASGVGKSTVRRVIERELAPEVECAELYEISGSPMTWDLAWRHRTTEKAVQRALELQQEGRHFMLCGDPVAFGELLAVPSAERLNGIAVCLLDVSPEAQTVRLTARGDDPAFLPHHIAFMTWMREHVRNPQHMPEVILTNGWKKMQWERWWDWQAGDPRWGAIEIDTTFLTPAEVSARVLAWVHDALDCDSDAG